MEESFHDRVTTHQWEKERQRTFVKRSVTVALNMIMYYIGNILVIIWLSPKRKIPWPVEYFRYHHGSVLKDQMISMFMFGQFFVIIFGRGPERRPGHSHCHCIRLLRWKAIFGVPTLGRFCHKKLSTAYQL